MAEWFLGARLWCEFTRVRTPLVPPLKGNDMQAEIDTALEDERKDPPGLMKAIRKFGIVDTFVFLGLMVLLFPKAWWESRKHRGKRN